MGYITKNYTEQGGNRTVIGGELDIIEPGQLKINGSPLTSASNQADSVAVDVPGLVSDFNSLLAKLKLAGLMKDE